MFNWRKSVNRESSMDTPTLKDMVIEQIKTVYDPEIPVNIYELGLIYEVNILEKERKAHILMTLTAPACPAAEIIPEEVKQKAMGVAGIDDAEVELTFDPPWDKEMMSEEAMLELGFL
jgi:FeS assembly SUF system protein